MIGYRLEDIAKVSAGNSAPKKDEFSPEGIPFIRAGSLAFLINGNSINKCERVSEKTANKKRLKLFNKGSILFAKSGMSAKMGRVYQLEENAYVVSHLAIIEVDKEKSNPSFIKYYFNINPPFHLIKDDAYPSIKLEDIKQITLNLPDLQTQNKIVAVLDKASRLLQKREESIQLLDELLRAQFSEMFGDISNPLNKWPQKPIVEICKNKNDVRCGPFGTQLAKSEFREEGVPLWGIKHINSEFSIPTDEFVTVEKADLLKNYILLPRDIVMTRKGSIGNCHIYPEDFELGIMHSDVVRIRVNEDQMNPYFLTYQFKYNDEVQWQIKRVSPGVVMAGINVSKLKKIKVRVPSLEIQNRFEVIFHVFREKLENLEKSKDDINDLLNSLLQKAFNGQLNFIDETALNTLLDAIDVESENNDLRDITFVYLRQLIERLDEQDFEDMNQYQKAKHAAFQLLREGKLTQTYKEDSKSVNLEIA